jgi:hypothetical protein
MKTTTVELTDLEITYLIFWYVSSGVNVFHTVGERELFHRLFLIYSDKKSRTIARWNFTPKPPYQPGEGPEDGSGNCAPVVFLGE